MTRSLSRPIPSPVSSIGLSTARWKERRLIGEDSGRGPEYRYSQPAEARRAHAPGSGT
jgi:hypothetical protein